MEQAGKYWMKLRLGLGRRLKREKEKVEEKREKGDARGKGGELRCRSRISDVVKFPTIKTTLL